MIYAIDGNYQVETRMTHNRPTPQHHTWSPIVLAVGIPFVVGGPRPSNGTVK